MMTANRGRLHFFTLLELVLATAIFAMLVFSAGLGIMSVQQSWRRIHYSSEKLKNLMAIDRLVELTFRNIIPFTWPDETEEKEKPVFKGDKNAILFATIHRINEGDSNAIRFIRLYLENGALIAEYRDTPIVEGGKNDDGSGISALIAEYRDTPIVEGGKNDDGSGIRRETLATGIVSLSFLYLNNSESEELEWSDDWQEEDPDMENALPSGIQMTVEWENGSRYSWLRRTAGSGKNESLGNREASSSSSKDSDSKKDDADKKTPEKPQN